jgi:sugar transferase (PEP-CTERM/EpsH1 system associated)
MNVLFVTARLPFPPLKGDQVRGYHQLRLLSAHHRVTLLSLNAEPSDADHIKPLAPFVHELITIPITSQQRAINLFRGIASETPLQTMLYQSPKMTKAIKDCLGSGFFDLAYVQLARMAPYFFDVISVPRVIDLIDALSLNMHRRFLQEKAPRKWALYLEWKRMSRYERKICQTFEQATVVSQIDKTAIGNFRNLSINPNGVELERFSFVPAEARSTASDIVFSGNMSYFPNVNACAWFVEKVFPVIKQQVPNAQFTIVGANPNAQVIKLSKDNASVHVTGYVDSIHGHLAKATLAVVPLQSGSGIQNKVLEAMAAGTPLVVTPYALGGIHAENGKHLLISSDPRSFAESVITLMHDQSLRKKLSQNGRRMVEERFTWERCVADLELVFEKAIRRG